MEPFSPAPKDNKYPDYPFTESNVEKKDLDMIAVEMIQAILDSLTSMGINPLFGSLKTSAPIVSYITSRLEKDYGEFAKMFWIFPKKDGDHQLLEIDVLGPDNHLVSSTCKARIHAVLSLRDFIFDPVMFQPTRERQEQGIVMLKRYEWLKNIRYIHK
jgi:hypothetical protein